MSTLKYLQSQIRDEHKNVAKGVIIAWDASVGQEWDRSLRPAVDTSPLLPLTQCLGVEICTEICAMFVQN